jgi:hypothetical protein
MTAVRAMPTVQDAIAAYWKGDFNTAHTGFAAHASAGVAEAQVWLGAL